MEATAADRSRGRCAPAMPSRPASRDIGRAAARGRRPGTGRRASTPSPSGPSPSTRGAGANLLAVAPVPGRVLLLEPQHLRGLPRSSTRSSTSTGSRSRIGRSAAFTFGSTAHAAFEAFTRERRERIGPGEPAPTREDLERHFAASWSPTGVRRQDHRGGLRAPRRPAPGQLLGGRARIRGRGHRRGAGLRAGHRSRRRHARGQDLRRHRPHRPAARRRHRGHRLQDRQDQQPEGRRREPPAHDLRAGLPRRPGPGHARARDPVLHRERHAAVHRAHGRAAGPAREEILDRVSAPIRAGEFTANPGKACDWCDYRALCPERA